MNLHNCIELISVCDQRRFTRYSEKSLGDNADMTHIARYQELIRTYREHQKVLDENLATVKQNDANSVVVTANDVLDLVKELYKLELTGKDIRDFYDKQEEIRRAEIITKTEKSYKPTVFAPSTVGFLTNIFMSVMNPSNKTSSSNNPEHAVPAQ